MHENIRHWEHRAEQLAVRIEELADQPDVTRIALAGICAAAALCWFSVAWGDGLLLLGLPVLAVGCVMLSRSRRVQHDPSVDENERDLGQARGEIDQWLTRLTASAPRTEPEPLRPVFQGPAPALDVRFAVPSPPALPEPLANPEPALEHLPVAVERLEPEPMSTTIYEISEIRAGARILLEVRSTFDSAVDVAFD